MKFEALVGKRRAQRLSYKTEGDAREAGFFVEAWSIDDGPITRESLWVEIPSGRLKFPIWKSKIAPMSIISCTIAGAPEPAKQAWLPRTVRAKEIGKTAHAEKFDALAEELRNPVKKLKSGFGELVLNTEMEAYEADIPWIDGSVRLTLNGEFCANIAEQIIAVEKMLADSESWHRRAEKAVVDYLYKTWSEYWADSDEELSEEEFVGRMKIEAIHFLDDDRFQYYFNDGKLFGEHQVVASGSIDDGFDEALFEG